MPALRPWTAISDGGVKIAGSDEQNAYPNGGKRFPMKIIIGTYATNSSAEGS
jgi:hypothetical protein